MLKSSMTLKLPNDYLCSSLVPGHRWSVFHFYSLAFSKKNYVSGIIYYIDFEVWILSLSKMHLWFRMLPCESIASPFYCWLVFCCMDVPQFIDWPLENYIDRFQLLLIMDYGLCWCWLLEILVCRSLCEHKLFIHLGKYWRVALLGCRVTL